MFLFVQENAIHWWLILELQEKSEERKLWMADDENVDKDSQAVDWSLHGINKLFFLVAFWYKAVV